MKLNKDDALLLAVVIAVASPVLPLIGNPANLAALLLFLVLMRSGSARIRLRCVYLMVLILALASFSTIAGSIAVVGSYTVNPNAFGPFVRIAVCACAIGCAGDHVSMQRKLLWIGSGASLFAVLQYFLPTVAEFTSTHYLSPERSSVFTEDFSEKSIVRVIGFYENPSSVALMAITLTLVSVHAFARGQLKRSTLALFVLVNLAAGILSLSKIFFAGLSILLAQLVVLRFGKVAAIAALALIVGAVAIYTLDDPLVDVVRYAMESTLDPDIALKGRYLAEQEEVVSRSWLFGHGVVNVQNVNINDSAYLVTGYLIGLFGASMLGVQLAWWLWSDRRRVPVTLYLVLATMLVAGIGANSVLGFRVDILVTALSVSLCVALGRRHRERRAC